MKNLTQWHNYNRPSPKPRREATFAATAGSAIHSATKLEELRRRCHNIATGAEATKDDNTALNLIARLCEESYSPNDELSDGPSKTK